MSEIVTIESIKLVRESSLAWLCLDGDDLVWLSLSECDFTENKSGTYDVEMPEWLALDKGLI